MTTEAATLRSRITVVLADAPDRTLSTIGIAGVLADQSVVELIRELVRMRRDGLVKLHGATHIGSGMLRWELLSDVASGG